MIKQTKRAFSLAEILIALAIISVIATMGFTITQKNIASAYDMYFYTGYTGLQYAIADAYSKDYDQNSYTALHVYDSEVATHVNDLFRGNLSGSSTETIITAPNHIKYTIKRHSSSPYAAKIIMQVPSVKTKNGSNKEVTMYYMPEKYNFLILADDGDTATTSGDYATKRIDLFPFYIDDGIQGKSKQYCKSNANGTPITECNLIDTPVYEKRKYYTFRDAFCKVYPGETLKVGSTSIFNGACPAATADVGAIKLANPKKVF